MGIQSEKSCERENNHNTNNPGEEMESRVQNISSSNFDLEATQLIDRVQKFASGVNPETRLSLCLHL